MLDLAALQVARGDEVAFFATAHPDNEASPFERRFPAHVELDPAPAGGRRLKAAARMVWSPAARRGMEDVVRSFRPDVVHLHNIYHHLSPSVLQPLRRRGVPAVMTLHDYKLVCPTYQLLAGGKPCEACVGSRHLLHAATKRCKDGSLTASAALALESSVHRILGAYDPVDVLVCPSRFLAGRLERAGVGRGRVDVLAHFVDASTVVPKATPGGPVVYAGRLAEEKGVDVLVRAMARLPQLGLLIAGEGPRRRHLEELAGGRPGQVSFLGRLGRSDLLDAIRSASALVLPSRWHENQPLAVLEAFACGVPVVTTRMGGLPELVREGVTGWLVEPGDERGLADVMEAVAGDPARALAMGRAARADAEGAFAPARHLAGLDEVYRRAGERAAVRRRSAAGA